MSPSRVPDPILGAAAYRPAAAPRIGGARNGWRRAGYPVTMSEQPVGRAWVTWTLVGVCYLVAGALNARELVFGAHPGAAGALASGAYLAAWSVHAAFGGRSGRCRALRSMAVIWAAIIGGTAICGTLLRLNLGTGASIPGGWVVPAILVVVAAPLYGLAGAFEPDPLAVLVAVAVAGAALTIGLALATRASNPAGHPAAPSGAGDGLSRE